MAAAYEKLDDTANALKFYRVALEAYKRYRATKRLAKPTDFLDDLEEIGRKIIALSQAAKQ